MPEAAAAEGLEPELRGSNRLSALEASALASRLPEPVLFAR